MSSPNEETPAANGGSNNTLLAERVTPILPRIGASVDAQLDATLWGLVDGSIQLSDCCGAIQDLWAVAAEQGRKSANRDEIEHLTRDRDRWYVCWANGWTPGEYLRRQTAALWAEGLEAAA